MGSIKYTLKEQPVSAAKTINYRGELNDEQYAVVTSADGPCLVLAGAGSGKTRTLIYRLAYLFEHGVHPENIMLVTFTNKAARNMRDRVEMLLKMKPKGLWNGTFHHIGNRTLRLYAKSVGYKPDFGILDEEDSKDLLKICMNSLGTRLTKDRFPKPRVLKSVISYSVNSGSSVADALERDHPYFSKFSDDIQKVKDLYQERKLSTNTMDYDDLLSNWLKLLTTNRLARERFTGQFRYILVDEYQDTNSIQSEIIHRLASGSRNILVVGDDAQAIYSFRGATVRNIMDFPKRYKDAKIFRLETNYRSSPEILDLANDSISNNSEQFKKTLHTKNESFERPVLIEPRDMYFQAGFVAQRILELRSEGVDLKDMAVLFRAHYQSAELQMELVKRDIPYVVRGGIRFFEQAHIKDVLSYMKLSVNPIDEISWIRALTMQPGIGSVYADRIYKDFIALGMDFSKLMSDRFDRNAPKAARSGLKRFKKIVGPVVRRIAENRSDEAIRSVLENGYESHVLANFDNGKDRLDDLRELVNFAHSYRSVKTFLSDISLREGFKGETLDGSPNHDEYLVLSTIHQAKGLEWNAVFVIGLCEGQFPHPKSIENPLELEEERRLFYVAATRTKQYLYLVHPITRYDYHMGMVITRRSLFLEELGSDLYSTWDLDGEPDDDDAERVIDISDNEAYRST
ncbi:MAG: ATP-dependent helicase [Candidatus Omnitrophota bacterium]